MNMMNHDLSPSAEFSLDQRIDALASKSVKQRLTEQEFAILQDLVAQRARMMTPRRPAVAA